MSTPAFTLRGVTKTYATGAGAVRALDGVDLDLFPGEFVVLEAIARVADAVGATTVLITHNAGIAAMADRVLSMSDGRIVAERTNPGRAAASTLHW